MAPEALAKSNNKANKGGGSQPSQPAAPLTCASGSVTSNPLAGGSSLSYSNCMTSSGNDVSNTVATSLSAFLDSTLGAGDWLFGGKSDNGGAVGSNGFSWQQSKEGEGTWSLTQAINAPFVISLKSGNGYAAYYIDGSSATQSGTWATFNGKDLSHASIFIGKPRVVSEPPKTTVPEPASTAAIALVGLSAVGLMRKKQG
ncbi:PEP-CTERM sorting domain-containing protein [Leptolyngbya sp. KIOST-1]|uniref:PEP-CTERM sorting domain-containing protein n=1 Tax=Leptolyngbya sp. KIOST-1 TaxID=1229172 RepID=UPI000562E73E|nr:PEP-CTERM sorting domain-containing protein [Leptolyngbya sp. KIOST-1]